jgi:hypothetical protein
VKTSTWVGILLGLALPLESATSSAATYFQYRDVASGCDVFVDQADRIPRKCRDGARIVTENQARSGMAMSAICLRSHEQRFRADNDAARRESELVAAAVNAKLASNRGRVLSESEIEALRQLSSPRMGAYVLAFLAALAAWIAVMVAAFRQDHWGWAMLMLFLSTPVAFVYLFLGLGENRCRFKAACALGLLSPVLVFLASLCRLFPVAAQ